MPTLEGIVFIPLALYFFLCHPDRLFPLLIVSTVFEASSIVSSGPAGIQPYYFVALLFVLQAFLRRPALFTGSVCGVLPFWTLFAFLLLGVISAFVLPIVFAGIPVYDPHNGIDEGLLFRPPLHLQSGNFTQAILLPINVSVVIAAATAAPALERAQRAFFLALYIAAGIVFVQFVFFAAGITFPAFLLNNNPGYGIVNQSLHQLRPNGSYTEPSMAGAAMAAFAGGALAMYLNRQRGIGPGALASLACLLIASSSSVASLVVLILLLIVTRPVVRWPCVVRLSQLRRLSLFLIAGLFCSSLLLVPSIRGMLLGQTIEKGSTASALVRFTADAYALDLVRQTYGIGVGLGSNRPSSLITSLLSQVGVAGLLLFGLLIIRTLTRVDDEHRWIVWSCFSLIFAMCLGVPDVSYPLMWVLIAMAVQSKASARAAVP